ncbi:hypothetical protein ACFYXH_08515 [Streptomyces sp. NPDC002730]|uniref:hypothetical protein n=1 Tax=Streptomyces sp. NPDC002730 TaxID=3364662 RepID=UPI00368B0774
MTGGRRGPALLWSHACRWEDLLVPDRLLVALDFCGEVREVLSQPLKLRFCTRSRWRKHTPDFLVLTRMGTWLVDAGPARLIDPEARESLAAAAEVALACGWRYSVVAG